MIHKTPSFIVGVNTDLVPLDQIIKSLEALEGVTVLQMLGELGMVVVATEDPAPILNLPGVSYVSREQQVSLL